LKAHFHITISGRPPSWSALGAEASDIGHKPDFTSLLKPLLASLVLAAVAIAILIVALVIGSVIAFIVLGGLATVAVGLILKASFRRAQMNR
jgi:hypothetical protein